LENPSELKKGGIRFGKRGGALPRHGTRGGDTYFGEGEVRRFSAIPQRGKWAFGAKPKGGKKRRFQKPIARI